MRRTKTKNRPSQPARRYLAVCRAVLATGLVLAACPVASAWQEIPATPADLETPETALVQMAPDQMQPAVVSLDEAIDLAIANDPVIQQVTWQLDQARGLQYQASRKPNPVASIVAGDVGILGEAGQWGLQISQDVVRNCRPQLRHGFYEARILGIQQQFEIRRWQISQQTVIQYLAICRQRQEVAIQQDQLELLEELSELINDLFRKGEVSPIDPANVELEILNVRQAMVELELGIAAGLKALAIPLGLAPGISGQTGWKAEFDWNTSITSLLAETNDIPDDIWLAEHPQIQFAAALVSQQQRLIALARARRRPDIQLQASINYDAPTDDPFAAFQVGVPLLKNNNQSGLISAAMAGYQRYRENQRHREMQLRQAWALQAGQLAKLRSRVVNVRDQIIPPAEQNMKRIRVAFGLFEADWLLLKSGADRLLESKLRLVRAEYDLFVARTRLDTLLLDVDTELIDE